MMGYWKRGNQYWRIKGFETLLINEPEKGKHYNGSAHIFFHNTDGPVFCQEGRIRIKKEEFEKVRDNHIELLGLF